MDKIIKYAVIILAVCLASYIGGCTKGREAGRRQGYADGYEAGYNTPRPADTVFVTDTIREQYPVPASVTPAGYELAPVGTLADLRAQVDSLEASKPDTVEVYIPVQIERLEYKKPDYHLIISGWHPRVELIEVYQQTAYINNYIDRPVPFDRPVPYSWTLSATADALVQKGFYQARAGVRLDWQVEGPLRWHADAGYQVSNLGRGPYLETGLQLVLFHNR